MTQIPTVEYGEVVKEESKEYWKLVDKNEINICALNIVFIEGSNKKFNKMVRRTKTLFYTKGSKYDVKTESLDPINDGYLYISSNVPREGIIKNDLTIILLYKENNTVKIKNDLEGKNKKELHNQNKMKQNNVNTNTKIKKSDEKEFTVKTKIILGVFTTIALCLGTILFLYISTKFAK